MHSAVPPILLLAGRRRQTRQERSSREGTDAPAGCGALGGRHSLTADPNPREWRWAMFVNRATLRNFNHQLGRSMVWDLRAGAPRDPAAVRPCNDNQRASTASFRRTRRPVLFCRWRTAPGGALECVWDIEAASAGEEPGLCQLDESLRRSNRHCGFPATIDVAGKLHCAVNPSQRLDSPRRSFLYSTRSGASVGLTGKRESGATLARSLVRSCLATVSGEPLSQHATGLCRAKPGKAEDGDDLRARRPA
jgi:hypothetical protein